MSSNQQAMTNIISDRINNMAVSATLAMAKKARELKATGVDVISLSLGEPDFDTPNHIIAAAKQAMDDGYTRYTPVSGFQDLKDAISAKFSRDNGLKYSPDQIVVSTGAKHSIMNVIMSTVNPGDEVIIPAPFWVSYTEMVKLAGGVPVIISSGVDTNYKFDINDLKASITSKTKLFLFSSPCNPSGSVFSENELCAIADVLAEHEKIHIISDEIYEHINYGHKHHSIGNCTSTADRVITVNGVSKGFAMTGWRIGYIGAPLEIAKACEKLQGQFTSGANAVAQKAALAAITSPLEPTYAMREAFQKRRDLMFNLLQEIDGLKPNYPEGAFYVYPDVSAYFGKRNGDQVINNSMDLSLYLLEFAHVSVVAGSAFGTEGCVRISYAASDDQIREAISRIKSALEKLQ
jgi:aspartate aminotransferase